MIDLIYISVVVIFAFLLRIPFASLKDSDADVALNLVKNLKSGFPYYKSRDAIPDGFNGYPRFNHFIISIFPEKHWQRAGYLLNIFYDVLTAILLYLALKVFVNEGVVGSSSSQYAIPFLGALLYVSTPAFFPVIGTRLKSFGGRALGALFFFLYFSFLGSGLLYDFIPGFILASIIGTLIIFTSQFSLQAVIFTTLFLSIFYFTFIPLLVLVGAVLLGAIVAPKHLKHYITGKANHYVWYFRNQHSNVGSTSARNRLRDYIYLPVYLFRDKKKFLHSVTRNLTFVIALWFVPGLALLVVAGIVSPGVITEFSSEPMSQFLIAVVGGGVVAFVLTSLKPLLFLGEAERYLEQCVPFISVLIVLFGWQAGWDHAVFFFLLILQISIVIGILIKTKLLTDIIESFKMPDESQDPLYQYLNSIDSSLRILTIPAKNSWKHAYFVDNENIKFYRMFEHGENGIDGYRYMDEDLIQFSIPRTDLDFFKKKYDINCIIIQKTTLQRLKKEGVNYILDNYNLLIESENYLLYSK